MLAELAFWTWWLGAEYRASLAQLVRVILGG